MLGYTEKELSHLEVWDEITHPDDRVACAERYTELVQGKRESDEWEQRLIRRDGRIVATTVRYSATLWLGMPQASLWLANCYFAHDSSEFPFRRCLQSRFHQAVDSGRIYDASAESHLSCLCTMCTN